MAINKTINIDINQNADEAAKGFNNLNKSLDATSESIRDVNATFEEVYGDLQPLTTRLGEAEDRLYELAAAGQQTSKEYQDLLETVANYRKIQIQTDAVVDAASVRFDEKLGGALQGAASAFAGVQGAMALMGSESEELEETLVKLQGAMALAEGVRGIREGIKSFQALGTTVQNVFKGMSTATKAFAVTGIGLLVTGIGLVVSNLDKLKEKFLGVTQSQTALKEATKEGAKAFADATIAVNEVGLAFEQAKKGVISKEQALKTYNEKLGGTLGATNDLNEAEKTYRENSEKYIKAVQARAIAQALAQQAAEKLAEAESAALEDQTTSLDKFQTSLKLVSTQFGGGLIFGNLEEQQRDAQKRQAQRVEETKARAKAAFEDLNALSENYLKEALSIESDLAKGKEKLEKKSEESTKATAKAIANYTRQLEKERIDAMEDGMEKRIKLLEFELQGELLGIEKNGKKARELRIAIEERYAKAIQKVRDEYKQLDLDREEAAAEALKEVKVKTGQETLDALQTQLNKEIELKRAAADKEAQIEAGKAALRKRNIEFAIESTKQGLEVIISLTELFGKKGEKQARKAFQVQKAAQIASATIDTYRNAVSAYGSQFVPVPDPTSPVRGGIAAGIAVAAGLANIAAIASQKFEGGGGGSVTEPSTAGLEGGTIAPQFNVVGDSGINQLAQLQQQPVQAYVVSGEVTSAQALDRNRVKNATL